MCHAIHTMKEIDDIIKLWDNHKIFTNFKREAYRSEL